MPVRNGGLFLAEAIRSVLLQTFQDFELIVVDDHSTDDSERVIYSFARQDERIKPLKNESIRGGPALGTAGLLTLKAHTSRSMMQMMYRGRIACSCNLKYFAGATIWSYLVHSLK
jgi:glycosyltransferase involved in cell wall biosynthesis